MNMCYHSFVKFQKMLFMPDSRNFLYGSIAFCCALVLALPEWGRTGFFSFLYYGLVYMGVFFHEIGHTIFMWFYGIPTLPIFDFKYGGGYSVSVAARSWPAQIVVWVALAYGLYSIRDRLHPIALYPLIGFCGLFGLIGLSDFYEDIILFMGHGAQAVLGGFMLARGFYAVFLVRPSERWLNVFVGAFFIFDQIKMCHSLLYDADYKMQYDYQKGGHGMGDLSRIAGNHDGWTQNGVTIFLMVFTIAMAVVIPAIIGWLARRDEE